jgi:hypothetical protein
VVAHVLRTLREGLDERGRDLCLLVLRLSQGEKLYLSRQLRARLRGAGGADAVQKKYLLSKGGSAFV